MSGARPLWQRLLPLVIASTVVTSIIIREWPYIVRMSPGWGLMLTQTLGLIAAGIVLAALAAAGTAWYRKRTGANG